MFPEKIHNRLRCLKRTSLSVSIIVGCLCGCSHTQTKEFDSSRPYVNKVEEFLPLDSGTVNSTYTVDGTKTNYVLRSKKSGTTTTFQAMSMGVVVDEEAYDVLENSVLLTTAVGENFDPPVVLVKFPLHVGEKYEWKGKLCCEFEKIDGTATITTSTDYVQGHEKSYDAIKAEMNLRFGEGATRKLSFWFVKGKGIVKTEMSKNIRETKL